MIADSIADCFFTTSEIANDNLRKEGKLGNQIFFVGNIMINIFLANKHRFIKPKVFDELNLENISYFVLTIYRSTNVDKANVLIGIMNEILNNVNRLSIVFPIHSETIKVFNNLDITADNLYIVDSLRYLEFNSIVKHFKTDINDSDGIIKETSIMNIPYITLRDNTERLETISLGTNELIGTNFKNVKPALDKLFRGQWKKNKDIPKCDGMSAKRIVFFFSEH